MAYEQDVAFNPYLMGKQSGWCLQNCRLGYGKTYGTYPSAKADMDDQKAKGTFHEGLPPTNISVPVYCDTYSEYEHVGVMDKGIFYSDGHTASINNFKVFGWGECCDGMRVVHWEDDPEPQKSIEDIAREVIKGNWGNGEDRKKRLTDAGYNYDEVQAKVNEILYGTAKEEYYMVVAGDCLSIIAEKFNTTVDELVRLNGIANPNLIYAGQKIRIR